MFKSIGHFFATIGNAIVKAGQVAQAVEAPVEAISSIFVPAALPIERIAFQLFGNAVATVGDASSAVKAQGVNVVLDAQLIADIEALIPQFEQLAAAMKVVKPAGVPVTAPAK